MLYVYEGLSYFTRESKPIEELESIAEHTFNAPFVIVDSHYAETPGLEYKLEGFKCFLTTVESSKVISQEVPFAVYLKAYYHFSEYPKTEELPENFEELLENELQNRIPRAELCTLSAVQEVLSAVSTKYYYVPNEDLESLIGVLGEFGFDGISPKTLYAIYSAMKTGQSFPFRILALPCHIDASTLMYEGMYEEEIEPAPEEDEPVPQDESHEILDRVLEEESREDFDEEVESVDVETSAVFNTTQASNDKLVFSREDEFITYFESILGIT